MKKILTLCTWLLCATAAHAQWNNIAPDGADYVKIKFTSANTAYVIKGNPVNTAASLSKTVNAGSSWSSVPFPSVLNVRDFYFLDDNNGFICADTAGGTFPYSLNLFKTTNGGSTWTLVHTFPGAVPVNSKVYFRDALHGFVTETFTRIWITSDGGITWTSQDFGYAYFQDIDFPSANVGYITCADGTFAYYGLVLKTTDGGTTWSKVFDFTDVPLSYTTAGAVDFIDDNTGYMETLDNLYKTTDGGVTWDSLPYAHNHGMGFYDLEFISPTTAYGCDANGGIYKTTDAGLTWTVERPQDTVTWLYSIDIESGSGYAAGTGGKILKKSGITGLNDGNETERKFNVYPNPSPDGLFYIGKKDARPLDIEVFTAWGEKCMGIEKYNGHVLDFSGLESGTYIIRCKTGDDLPQTQKISILK